MSLWVLLCDSEPQMCPLKSALKPSPAQTPPMVPYYPHHKVHAWSLEEPAISVGAYGQQERWSGSRAQRPQTPSTSHAAPWVPAGPKRPLLALWKAETEVTTVCFSFSFLGTCKGRCLRSGQGKEPSLTACA